jgi:hypothetical protein
MTQSPTSKQVTINNAAKDDTLGDDGQFTFTHDQLVAKLLANDPGGAAKLDLSKQFFFGDRADGPRDQKAQDDYLALHHIAHNADGSYIIGEDATDINYFVQIGNRGTWSEAHVDVTAPVPHAGKALFVENFDGYDSSVQQIYQDGGVDVFATVDLKAASGWVTNDVSELGVNGYGEIETTSDDFWFDTQNSPGQVNISHAFTDQTDSINGQTAVLSFDAAVQNLDYKGNHYETDANASFAFQIDGVTVGEFNLSDFNVCENNMQHFAIPLEYTSGDHTLTLVDTSGAAGFTGFAIDSIHINDWTF